MHYDLINRHSTVTQSGAFSPSFIRCISGSVFFTRMQDSCIWLFKEKDWIIMDILQWLSFSGLPYLFTHWRFMLPSSPLDMRKSNNFLCLCFSAKKGPDFFTKLSFFDASELTNFTCWHDRQVTIEQWKDGGIDVGIWLWIAVSFECHFNKHGCPGPFGILDELFYDYFIRIILWIWYWK